MKKTMKKYGFLVLSLGIFIACIIYGGKYKDGTVIYVNGYIENGNVRTANIISLYGYTSDEGTISGSEKKAHGVYEGSFGIPEGEKVELRVKANANRGELVSVSFKDSEGNVLLEEKGKTIVFNKTFTGRSGNWDFNINGTDVKAGDFKFTVLKK